MLRTGVLFSLFLSTLSLRRATDQFDVAMSGVDISIHALLAESDCSSDSFNVYFSIISIHALLAESDQMLFRQSTQKAISIHALLAESDDAKEEQEEKEQQISIHALLAESDAGSNRNL